MTEELRALRRRRDERRDIAVTLAVAALLVGAVGILIWSFPGKIRWAVAWDAREAFLKGIGYTAAVSIGALVLGMLIGTAAGLARMMRSPWLRQPAFVYTEVIRGTPWYVQLLIWYFCLTTALKLDVVFGDATAVVVGIAGLALFAGAYIAEIVRAGVESIDRGQWEAARSLGLSHTETLFRIVLPQATRRMLPPLTGEAVALIKESSLLQIIAVPEMTYAAKGVASSTYETFAAYIPLALLYLALTLPLSWLTRRLERRMRGHEPLPVSHL